MSHSSGFLYPCAPSIAPFGGNANAGGRNLGRVLILATAMVLLLVPAARLSAQTPSTRGLQWLATHQNANGTWGSNSDLVPRDTARALIAERLLHATDASVATSTAWLAGQRSFAANQFLAEQTVALSLSSVDASPVAATLVQQRSTIASDYGAFAEYDGNAYDSALAIEALTTFGQTYATAMSGALTTLVTRQGADGGWGLDRGFDSNTVMTAEALVALTSTPYVKPPQATVTAAQNYLLHLVHPDGSIGSGALETAVAFRALALSGYAVSGLSTATLAYLGTQQSADGSWSSDPYVTARVLEAFAANRANLTIADGGLSLSPSTVTAGTQVTATITISNIGAAASGATTVALYAGSANTTSIATANVAAINAGAKQTVTATLATSSMLGATTIVAVVNPAKTLDELRVDDDQISTTLTVNGKPDLQVYPADILVTPSQPQPQQSATVLLTIHNGGTGDAANVGYALYDILGSAQTLLTKSTFPLIAAGSAQVVSVPATFASGSHTLKLVADPDALVSELDETNNTALKGLSVSAVGNVDLRIQSQNLVVTPARPSAGTPVTISVLVENLGTDTVNSTVALYDGIPGAGGMPITSIPLSLPGQKSLQYQVAYTTTASSSVIYAVADPDNLVSEIDETNNSAFFALTDQLVDLSVARDGVVLPRSPIAAGQSIAAKIVVRNKGTLPATNAEVVVYDDLPQSGGVQVLDTTVNVAAQSTTVVPVSWTPRPGQRFVTVVVNPSHAIAEPNYADNRVTKYYIANASGGTNVSYAWGWFARPPGVDPSAVVVDPATLAVSGFLKLRVNPANNIPTQVTVFEDVDGDGAFNPEVDRVLGSTVFPVINTQTDVQVPLQGFVRFAPGKLMVYLDSSNAAAEYDETDNIADVWRDCVSSNAGAMGTKWSVSESSYSFSAVARAIDTNGDGVVDQNDVPIIFSTSNGAIVAHRGDNGAVLWTVPFNNYKGRQISPVVADLDGDGKAEILAHEPDHHLVALNAADGSRKWTSPELDRDPLWAGYLANYSYAGAPLVADLDGDGHPEVVVGRTCLNGADGTIKWIGSGGAGRAWDNSATLNGFNLYDQSFPDQEAPIAIDLDGDGMLEVVAGNTAYRADGSILWQRTDLTDGYTAAVTLPGQTRPSICLVTQGKVYLLRNDGTTIWGPVAIPNGALLGGAPTVFTYYSPNGGNILAIGVAGDQSYTQLNASDGRVRWTTQTVDPGNFDANSTSTNAATAFQFNSDLYLAYTSRDKFMILHWGGGIIYSEKVVGRPYFPSSPAIADVSGDGTADIVFPTSIALKVLSDPTWNPAPAIYNEFAYHTVNVSNDKGSIPLHETPTNFSATAFRTQQNTANFAPRAVPNLTISYLRADTSKYPASVTLLARIGNNGWASAPPASVKFYQVNSTTGVESLLGTASADALAPGAYEDVPLELTSFTAGMYSVDAALVVPFAECATNDKKTPVTQVHVSADVALLPSSLNVSDAQPRVGDTTTFTAAANVFGAIDPATLQAQFFLGNPAAGGTPISPALPVTPVTSSNQTVVNVSFTWTVNAPVGQQTVYVVFDPANAIAEDDETNNSSAYVVNVLSSDPVQKLSANLTLSPPTAESNKPVTVQALIHNIGSVPLQNVVLTFTAASNTGVRLTGSTTVAALAKNAYASLNFGAFTPPSDGTYTVTLSASDPAVTIVADPATIPIRPFVSVLMTATPGRVPTSLPLVQCHTNVSRTNTVVVPIDPLVAVITQKMQQGQAWNASALRDQLINCYKCHVHSYGATAFEVARSVPGVQVDEATATAAFHQIVMYQPAGNGQREGNLTSTISGAWAISFWHDVATAQPQLKERLDFMISRQASDGNFNDDDGRGPFNKAGVTNALSAMALARGYEWMRDARYQTALTGIVNATMTRDYHTADLEVASQYGIALAAAAPYIDPVLAQSATARVREIAVFLRGMQNADGSFGDYAAMQDAILRTAQAVYVLSAAGATGDDPAIRNGVTWLINQQAANGGWPYNVGVTSVSSQWFESNTWVMLALPSILNHGGQLNPDITVTLPPTTQLASSSPPPSSAIPASDGGSKVTWHFTNLQDSGNDVYFNVLLQGLHDGESRAVSTSATVSYADPYSGAPVSRAVSVPSVTGYSPIGVTVSTDKTSYSPNASVSIAEVVANHGGDSSNLTTDIGVTDANGTSVAAIAAADPLNIPSVPFPGWHYAIPASAAVADGTARIARIDVDFAAQIAKAGAAGTFDANSIRVSADSAPSVELPYVFYPLNGSGAAGSLIVSVPDSVASGSTLAMHVFFDTIDNGTKPVSMLNGSIGTRGFGQGLTVTFWPLDTTKTNPYTTTPSGLITSGPAFTKINEPSLNPPNNTFPTLPASWTSEWDGTLVAPVAGTYQFGLYSDDGSWLSIDGNLVVQFPGVHGGDWRYGSVALTAGFHTLRVIHFNWSGGYILRVMWALPGGGYNDIPPTYLLSGAPANAAVATLGAVTALADPSVTRTYSWNSGSTAAGTYTLNAKVSQGGTLVTTAAVPFTIAATAPTINTSLATDKATYDAGQTVHVTGSLLYASGNASLSNLTSLLSIVGPDGSTAASGATPISTLLPGQSAPVALDWPTGTAAAGTWTATLLLRDSTGAQLATKSISFTIRSSTQSGAGISGTISIGASSLTQGDPITFTAAVANDGNAALTSAPFAIRIVNTATQALADTIPVTVTVNAGATASQQITYDSSKLDPTGYTAFLVSLVTGTPVSLGSVAFTVNPVPIVFTSSVASDKTTYDALETAHLTATVVYTQGGHALSSVKETISVADASGKVVASSSTTTDTFNVHQTVTPAFDWAIGTTAPGNYTATIAVTDASGAPLTSGQSTFAIRSTSISGAGITGSVTAPASMMHKDPLTIGVTINDGGNDAITNAPFIVELIDPSNSTVVDSTSLTASAAMGASFTTSVTRPTAQLYPKTYTIALVSMITGQPVTLGTTSIEIKPLPTVVTATASTDKSTYDAGDAAHLTSTAVYTSGSFTLTNAVLTTSVVDGGGNVLATSSKTILSFAPGDSVTGALDWSVGTTAPGTYSATATVRDSAGALLTQLSSSFSIRSSAISGKGITGTISTPSSILQFDALPITVTISDGGNAALTNASFAVQVVDPSTSTTIDTIAFAATVGLGATTTVPLSYDSSKLKLQSYSTVLVATFPAAPMTLGTTSFAVNPDVFSSTITSDHPTYDALQTAHLTASVTYAQGGQSRANVKTVITISNPAGAAIATTATTTPLLNLGQTITPSFDWPAGTSAPGTYGATVDVTDGNGVPLTHAQTTFAVRSTALSGAGISGSVTGPASMMHKDPLTIGVAINDGGNDAIANAPFLVELIDPSNNTVVDSTSISASVAIGASFTTSVTRPTALLVPKTYTIALVSMITGQPVTLATTSIEIKPLPTVVTPTVASDQPSYDAGQTAHISSTAVYTSGSFTLSNAVLTTAVLDGTGAVLATSAKTILAFSPDDTATGSLDWSIGTTAPGTYTATVVLRDSGGNLVAQQSAQFAIRSSLVSGAGISGTIATSASIYQFDPLPLTVTITNNGNVALSGAAIAVQIVDPATSAVVDTVNLTASAAIGATATVTTTYNSSKLQIQTYSAKLVATFPSTPIVLASTAFEVKQVPIRIDASTTAPPRVAIWANCTSGNNTTPCPPVTPPFLTQTLTDAAMPWTLYGDQDVFMSAVRTGAFNVGVIDLPNAFEAKIGDELTATVHTGEGLLVLKNTTDALPKLRPAIGLTFNGLISAQSTLLDILATPFTVPSQLTVNGDGVTITLQGATPLARITSTQAAAMSYYQYGSGRSIVIPFDAEQTATADMAKLVTSALQYIARVPSGDARQVVPVDFAIATPPGGGSVALTIAVTADPALVLVDAQPALTTTSPPSWNVSAPANATVHYRLWFRLPAAIGSYTVSGAVGFQGQLPIASKSITLTTAADRAAMESAEAADLTALSSVIASGDQKALSDAQTQLTAIRAANPTDAAGFQAQVDRATALINDLASMAADVTKARADADRLLAYWQSEVGQ